MGDFTGSPVVKNLPSNAGDTSNAGSIPGLGGSHMLQLLKPVRLERVFHNKGSH